jgi:hypothetical protein
MIPRDVYFVNILWYTVREKFTRCRKGGLPGAEDGYHHENLKDELIREGLTILDREGYEGFSLRKVARACGVSQTAPYRHFKDKDALIAAILMEAMRAFNQSLEEAALRYPEDPKGRLKEIGVAYVRFFAQRPEYLRLLFSNGIPGRMDAPGGCQDLCGPEVRFKSGQSLQGVSTAPWRATPGLPGRGPPADELLCTAGACAWDQRADFRQGRAPMRRELP